MDHRPRLDRDVLETAAVSDARGPGQDRAGQSGISDTRGRSCLSRKQRGAKDCRNRQETPNPFGGEILKDKKRASQTECCSITRRTSSERKFQKPTEAEREQALLRGIEREIKLGWCEIQNAGSDRKTVDLSRGHSKQAKSKCDLQCRLRSGRSGAECLLKNGPTINAFDHHFTQRTIKVVFDGALGSRGAALLEAVHRRTRNFRFSQAEAGGISPMFEEALRRGIQVETHAIGDRANRVILDLYEQAFKAVPPNERKIREPRWRVEHAQIVIQQDIPRFAKLGVIASMQPSHAISDLFFAPSTTWAWSDSPALTPWKSLLKSGAIIAADRTRRSNAANR